MTLVGRLVWVGERGGGACRLMAVCDAWLMLPTVSSFPSGDGRGGLNYSRACGLWAAAAVDADCDVWCVVQVAGWLVDLAFGSESPRQIPTGYRSFAAPP